jgi:hypothetical protein
VGIRAARAGEPVEVEAPREEAGAAEAMEVAVPLAEAGAEAMEVAVPLAEAGAEDFAGRKKYKLHVFTYGTGMKNAQRRENEYSRIV